MEKSFWARRRLAYLREHKPIFYTELKVTGQLQAHLQTTEKQADEMWDRLIEQNQASYGLTEELKQREPMQWIGLMTNLRETMREQVLQDLIYA